MLTSFPISPLCFWPQRGQLNSTRNNRLMLTSFPISSVGLRKGVKGGGKTYHCGGEKVYHRDNG